MKATMIRKASNLNEWRGEYEVRQRNGEANTDEVVIEKTVTISKQEFDSLCGGLLTDKPFITENIDKMCLDENNVWHCIAVTAKESDIKILVESEGYDYARYTAVLSK